MKKIFVKLVLIYFFLLLAVPVNAIDETRVREYFLENGLKVILYEMHNAPVIYSNLTYNVGSKYEPYGQTGISHVVEHLMFKGTKRFPKGTISSLISANGGVFNAYTTTDRTVYYELLPKNRIDLALDIESQRMYKCEFDPEEFKSEIQVIMEERRMRVDNSAQGQLREELNTLLYKSHPYRNPVIGWMHDIGSVTRDQAYAYYRKYYTPNNACLVLVGDFNPEEMLDKVERYFGKVPRGPEPEKIGFSREELRGRRILRFSHFDIQDRSVRYYFQAPLRLSENGAALYVAMKILGGKSSTSRLYKRLVSEERLCQYAGAGFGFSKDPAYFTIGARLLDDADPDSVEKILKAEIDSMKNHPVSDYELQKQKNKITFIEITENQTAADVGGQLALYENFGGWRNINKWRKWIKAVSARDILSVMNKYCSYQNMVIVYTEPDTSSASENTELASTITDMGEQDSEAELTIPDLDLNEKDSDKRGFLSRLLSGFEEDAEEKYKPTLESIIEPNSIADRTDSLTLPNGVKVYYIEQHDFPTIFILGFIKTGRIQENRERPGIRNYVVSMLSRGTKHHSFDQISELKSFTPLQFNVDQSWNSISLQGYSLISDADSMLNLLYETLAEPSFPEEEIEKIRPILLSKSEKFMSSERMKAFYGMYHEVFRNHQYSVKYSGEPEVYKTVTRQELLDYWDKYFSPESLTLVAVGDFDRKWLYEHLSWNLGKWDKPSHDKHLSFEKIQAIKGKKLIVFTNPEYSQCRVDIAFNPVEGGIDWYIDDKPALDILEEILCRSSLTSRMGKKLRDDQGLCYNIRSNLWIRQSGGYWNIRTFVDKDNIEKMIDGILNEIRLIQEKGITEDELLRTKARIIAQLPLYIRTADDMGVNLYHSLRKFRRIDYFDSLREKYMQVTVEDVQKAARKYLDPDNYILAVSGNIEEKELMKYSD